MKILITGYTYTRENLFEVFDSYPNKQDLFFILPSNWQAKNGKVKFRPFIKEGYKIWHSPAFFFHSNYPIIGGLFKGWMPFIIFRVIYLRLTKGIDIIFTTGEPNLLSTLSNAILAKILGMKHVFHYWENISYDEKDKGLRLKIKKTIINLNLALSDGAICGMQKAEDILKKINPKFYTDVFLHAGFNVNKFKPDPENNIRKEIGSEGKFTFLFVGALGYRKGIHLAINSVASLISKYPNISFIIVGSGEYEEDLKKQVKSLNLEKHVTFIPWIENERLPKIYNSADAFLYPSFAHNGWEEQFGYSIAEASLCGLPVISTDSGSIYEALIDGKTGIMVKQNDESSLREAMERLINNKDLCIMLGTEGRKFITENFSNEVIGRKLFNFFNHVGK